MENRLYRSQTDQMIGGVCGGLGRYLGIDATFVRLFFVVLTLAGGSGVLIYLILWMVIPRDDQAGQAAMRFSGEELRERGEMMRDELIEASRRPNPNGIRIIGIGLIIAGGIFLLENLNIVGLRWLDSDLIWPALLIVGGGVLLFRAVKGN